MTTCRHGRGTAVSAPDCRRNVARTGQEADSDREPRRCARVSAVDRLDHLARGLAELPRRRAASSAAIPLAVHLVDISSRISMPRRSQLCGSRRPGLSRRFGQRHIQAAPLAARAPSSELHCQCRLPAPGCHRRGTGARQQSPHSTWSSPGTPDGHRSGIGVSSLRPTHAARCPQAYRTPRDGKTSFSKCAVSRAYWSHNPDLLVPGGVRRREVPLSEDQWQMNSRQRRWAAGPAWSHTSFRPSRTARGPPVPIRAAGGLAHRLRSPSTGSATALRRQHLAAEKSYPGVGCRPRRGTWAAGPSCWRLALLRVPPFTLRG